jgi:hypothetical protein
MAQNLNGWHLSRNVPVTLIVALVIQAVAIVGTYYRMQYDIVANTAEIIRFVAEDNERHDHLNATIERMRATDTEQAVRLERIDTTVTANQQTLTRIERKLDSSRK